MEIDVAEGPWTMMQAGLCVSFAGITAGNLGIVLAIAGVEPSAASGPPSRSSALSGTTTSAPWRRGKMDLADSDTPFDVMMGGLALMVAGMYLGIAAILTSLISAELYLTVSKPLCLLCLGFCGVGAPIMHFGSFWYSRVRSRERARLRAETLAILKRLEDPECRR